MNQTAVDMFCSIIADHIEAIFNGSIEQDEFAKRMRQTYDQAKAMEKEQIVDAFDNGAEEWTPIEYSDGQHYYNHTYDK